MLESPLFSSDGSPVLADSPPAPPLSSEEDDDEEEDVFLPDTLHLPDQRLPLGPYD